MEAVIGIGNELKGDDAFGKLVLDELERRGCRKLLLFGGNSPEGMLHRLRGKKIETLWIVDAADFGGNPGELAVTEKLPEKIVVSTHSTSLAQLVKYVKKEHGVKKTKIVLAQAKNIEFGAAVSEEIKKTVKEAVSLLL